MSIADEKAAAMYGSYENEEGIKQEILMELLLWPEILSIYEININLGTLVEISENRKNLVNEIKSNILAKVPHDVQNILNNTSKEQLKLLKYVRDKLVSGEINIEDAKMLAITINSSYPVIERKKTRA